MRYYSAVIERSASGYGVTFPDFPGCVSAGDTIEAAMANAAEALLLHMGGIEEDGDPIPEPSELDAPLPDWLAGIEAVRVLVPAIEPGGVAGVRQRSRFLADAAIKVLREMVAAE